MITHGLVELFQHDIGGTRDDSVAISDMDRMHEDTKGGILENGRCLTAGSEGSIVSGVFDGDGEEAGNGVAVLDDICGDAWVMRARRAVALWPAGKDPKLVMKMRSRAVPMLSRERKMLTRKKPATRWRVYLARSVKGSNQSAVSGQYVAIRRENIQRNIPYSD